MTPHGKDHAVKTIRLFRSLDELKDYWQERAGVEVKKDPDIQNEKNLAKLKLLKGKNVQNKPHH
jgi:hypothetical protein